MTERQALIQFISEMVRALCPRLPHADYVRLRYRLTKTDVMVLRQIVDSGTLDRAAAAEAR